MNYWYLSAAIITGLAAWAHLFIGTRETLSLQAQEAGQVHKIQAIGAWHLVSVDLVFITLLMGIMAWHPQQTWVSFASTALSYWMLGWAIVWIGSVRVMSPPKGLTYMGKLPQGFLFGVLAVLIILGSR